MLSATLLANDGREQVAPLTLHAGTKAAGLMHALKWGGSVFVGACVTLLIPIIHIAAIGVILFVVPAVSIAVYKIYSSSRVWHGTALCPACGADWELRLAQIHYPRKEHCPKCRAEVQLTVAALAQRS